MHYQVRKYLTVNVKLICLLLKVKDTGRELSLLLRTLIYCQRKSNVTGYLKLNMISLFASVRDMVRKLGNPPRYMKHYQGRQNQTEKLRLISQHGRVKDVERKLSLWLRMLWVGLRYVINSDVKSWWVGGVSNFSPTAEQVLYSFFGLDKCSWFDVFTANVASILDKIVVFWLFGLEIVQTVKKLCSVIDK